jgi:hypothetical protein
MRAMPSGWTPDPAGASVPTTSFSAPSAPGGFLWEAATATDDEIAIGIDLGCASIRVAMWSAADGVAVPIPCGEEEEGPNTAFGHPSPYDEDEITRRKTDWKIGTPDRRSDPRKRGSRTGKPGATPPSTTPAPTTDDVMTDILTNTPEENAQIQQTIKDSRDRYPYGPKKKRQAQQPTTG